MSFVSLLEDPNASVRQTIYAEKFRPFGRPLFKSHSQAVRDQRYKLIRLDCTNDEFYDLAVDPGERRNLIGEDLDAHQQKALDSLSRTLDDKTSCLTIAGSEGRPSRSP